MPPRVFGEPGLRAGVSRELLVIPVPFDRHLRKQQAAAVPELCDQTVTAQLQLRHVDDRQDGAEHRNLQADTPPFRDMQRRKSRIRNGRRHGTAFDDLYQRPIGFHVADTAAKISVDSKRDERAGLEGDRRLEIPRRR